MKICPINGNLLVEPPKKEEVSKGGIYLPEDSQGPNAKGLTRGTILDWDPKIDNRKYNFKKGMIILFNKFSHTEITIPSKTVGENDKVFLLIPHDKIEAYIDNE